MFDIIPANITAAESKKAGTFDNKRFNVDTISPVHSATLPLT